MVREKIIDGKICRKYIAGGIWVSDDGTQAYKEDKYDAQKQLTIFCDKDSGEKYANVGRNQKVRIALAVITCFCPPKPKDGKNYEINFKDGNVKNCHKGNLEWKLKQYKTRQSQSVVMQIGKEKLLVNRDGTVWDGKQQKKINDFLYDGDIDLFNCIKPFIESGSSKYFMDDIMKDSGFVNGDDSVLKQPVILHRDNDRMNFASDNLEWTEATDPRYIAYQEQVEKEKHDRRVELNPGRTLYPGW